MKHDAYFRGWVANTVHSISGIWDLDWRGMERKRPLTDEEIRATACQEEYAEYFNSKIQGSTPHSMEVSNHKRTIH